MTFLSPNLGHISFLQGVVIAQKYREFITTEFFSPQKTDSLNFKSIKKFNGTLRLPTNGTLNPKLRGVFFWGSVSETWMKGRLVVTRGVPGGLVRRHLVGAAGDSTGALHCGLCTRRGLGRSGVVVESKRGTYRTATNKGVMRKRCENEISEIHEYFQ